jgi:hypothetical protein
MAETLCVLTNWNIKSLEDFLRLQPLDLSRQTVREDGSVVLETPDRLEYRVKKKHLPRDEDSLGALQVSLPLYWVEVTLSTSDELRRRLGADDIQWTTLTHELTDGQCCYGKRILRHMIDRDISFQAYLLYGNDGHRPLCEYTPWLGYRRRVGFFEFGLIGLVPWRG